MIRKFFALWGAEDEEVEPEPTGHPTAVPSTRELTAEEIENMTARAADRASRKARKDLATELGFEDLNAMKVFVASKVEADQASMDERERAIAEANTAKAEAEALRSNLASDRLDTAVLRQVVSAGVSDERKLNRITALVRLDLDSDVVNDEDTWEEAIAAALSAVKEDAPELFAGAKVNFGTGDGGARGGPVPPKDEAADRQKKYEDQFAGRGFVEYDPSSF